MKKVADYETLVKYLLHLEKWREEYRIEINIMEGHDISKNLTPEFCTKLITLLLCEEEKE